MPSWKFEGLEQYAEKLKTLEYRSEGVLKYALYEGAKIAADAVRAVIPTDSGDLADSMSLDVMKKDGGYIYTKISFVGYDRRGVPNAVKANVIQSGRSDQKRTKNPFVRNAIESNRGAIEAAIGEACDRKLNEIFK